MQRDPKTRVPATLSRGYEIESSEWRKSWSGRQRPSSTRSLKLKVWRRLWLERWMKFEMGDVLQAARTKSWVRARGRREAPVSEGGHCQEGKLGSIDARKRPRLSSWWWWTRLPTMRCGWPLRRRKSWRRSEYRCGSSKAGISRTE